MLSQVFSTLWWIVLLRGLVGIAFGLFALFSPGATLAVLVAFFTAWILVDGIFTLIHALRARKDSKNWWLFLIEGVLGVAIGVLAWNAPGITALILLFYVAVWAIMSGISRIALAIRLRDEIQGELWLALGGVVSILFGFLLMARPGAGALAVLWVIGLFALANGILLVLFALKARSLAKRVGKAVQEVRAAR